MGFTEIILPLLITLTLVKASTNSANANHNFTLPSYCPKTCGDIKIEYPFGIGHGCFYAAGFNLTCSYDSKPPRLLLENSNLQVKEFDINVGLVRIESPYAIMNVSQESISTTLINLTNSPFTISDQHYVGDPFIDETMDNSLFVFGCNGTGSIVDPITNTIVAACSSICSSNYTSTIDNGFSDSGNGYCRIFLDSLKFNKTSLTLQLSRPNYENENNHMNNSDRSNIIAFLCDEFFCSEADPQSFIKNEDKTKTNTSLSWHIKDHSSCKEAWNYPATYACRSSNTNCYDITDKAFYVDDQNDTVGYICRCSFGHHGNPYIPYGCQLDIDECNSSSPICKGVCINTNGSFNCLCPLGTSGDPLHGACIPNKKKILLLGLSVGASIGVGLLFLCITLVFLSRKWKEGNQKKIRQRNFHQNHGLLLQQLVSTNEHVEERINIFSLEEIEKATNNFDEARVVGSGGQGTVYKGILSDQRVVAIKKSKTVKKSEIDQFINEVALLSQINHRNVVKLFGCCLETEVPLLIYEFISNGALSDHLHVSQGESKLSWDDRLRIAIESAGALAYLHSAASISIFHRDVKSSNILLDDTLRAKVSDFGASKFIPLDQTHTVTVIYGTFGYLDPEYYQTGQLTEKSDVYSFGVILLELLTGKKPIYLTKTGLQQNLATNFLQTTREETLFDLIEDRILQEGTEQELFEISSLIEMCLSLKGVERPTMKEVEYRLQGIRKTRMKKRGLCDPKGNEEIEFLLTLSSYSSSELVNQINQGNSRNYSLEKEFLISQNYPRFGQI
ncbi:putative wall-associated receptor kinase-like 16 isoform X2 [Zingiber officinale]|uniref:putative wall-associated receptor kinase-like 16 isoform X2 n=1 Tax=Zingiber officinale TaxID=94328 RepID=UPI001C4B36B2|nr:putative wall-associated receptor kinase-like 16 isoform X2 [Zingiber officinale]